MTPKEIVCGLDAFKNERDYIGQSGHFKTTVAAMDWAINLIERLTIERDDARDQRRKWQDASVEDHNRRAAMRRESILCVGGPRAGRRLKAEKGSGFFVAVLDQVAEQDPSSSKTVKVDYTNYHAEVFTTAQGDVSMWVPDGQTHLETITMLLDAYEHAEMDDGDLLRKVRDALDEARALIVIEELVPAEHKYEKANRARARDVVKKQVMDAADAVRERLSR